MGSGEIHFVETPDPTYLRTSHFAVEVTDWKGMLAHLSDAGVSLDDTFGREGGGVPKSRDHDGSDYVYIRDPDGKLIELVHHPKGLRWARPTS